MNSDCTGEIKMKQCIFLFAYAVIISSLYVHRVSLAFEVTQECRVTPDPR